MEKLLISEIIKAVHGRIINRRHENDIYIEKIITDTRENFSQQNSIFVAIKGENYDGNDFAVNALEKGAKFCICSNPGLVSIANIILVDDTMQALVDIAGLCRSKIEAPFVGITGSVGKTTTKEMTAWFLHAKYNVLKTQGNYNNQIGMPKTIFSFKNHQTDSNENHNCAVIEMGTCCPGEINQLTMAVKPNVAVITNIGLSHIENFKTRENILKGKMEIVNGLAPDGTLILNYDDDFLQMVIKGEYHQKFMAKKIMTYSVLNENATVCAKNIQQDGICQTFEISYNGRIYKAKIPCIGVHNVQNALAGFCCGACLNVNLDDGLKSLERYSPTGPRQQIEQFEDGVIIKDFYNASPDSMKAAIEVLSQLNNIPKIAVLSDMLELGLMAKSAHEQIGEFVASKKIDYLLVTGEMSENYLRGAKDTHVCAESFATKSLLCKRLRELYVGKAAVLIKASRGVKMEKIYQELTQSSQNKG